MRYFLLCYKRLYFFGMRQLFKEAARKHPKKAYTAVFVTQCSLLLLCKRPVPFGGQFYSIA